MAGAIPMRKILGDELANANERLRTYENKILELHGKPEAAEHLKYLNERVAYYSSVAQQVRKALLESKAEEKEV